MCSLALKLEYVRGSLECCGSHRAIFSPTLNPLRFPPVQTCPDPQGNPHSCRAGRGGSQGGGSPRRVYSHPRRRCGEDIICMSLNIAKSKHCLWMVSKSQSSGIRLMWHSTTPLHLVYRHPCMDLMSSSSTPCNLRISTIRVPFLDSLFRIDESAQCCHSSGLPTTAHVFWLTPYWTLQMLLTTRTSPSKIRSCSCCTYF